MRKKTIYLLGIVLTIILGTLLYCRFCCSCGTKTTQVAVAPPTPALPANGFKLETNGYRYYAEDNFNFISNGFNTLLPLNDSINIGLESFKAFLSKNPNIKVLITGFAKNDEKNNSAFTNLGEARAINVKNYMVSKGFSSDLFDTKGEIVDSWKKLGDTVIGPINFSLSALKADSLQTDWAALKDTINAKPLILYFQTGATAINLSVSERENISEIVKYLDHVPNSAINITGYTDNTGSFKNNIKLGKDRAEFLKAYFIKNGIPQNRISTSSKGANDPIADNNSIEGRAKNRRTVVTIN
ncbi:OmpA family protein [Pedobacter jeongneungensis]|uniref:OmpA family protein n=1 Tax=Pedobacter jeongneungensis TaxID=947309 RepID=UPI000468FB5D|nr:OmpA family protein [Pedobacter jeongneungensis]